jgi:DNA-binding CsgD family transcriptional regulator
MSVAIERLFEAITRDASIDDLGVVIDRIRDVYSLTHVAYLAVTLGKATAYRARENGVGLLKEGAGTWARDPSGILSTSSYSTAWVEHYVDQDYKRIDPVIEHAVTSFLPLDWRSLPWDSKKRRLFLREAVESGLGNQGYTIPIRGPDGQFAIFSINKNCPDDVWDKFIAECRSDFLIISHFYHQKVLEIEGAGRRLPPVKLSDREKDALSYIASGKARAQVAHDLGISENTLRVYLDSARHKLGALNLPHAVAVGVSRGIISSS